MGEWETAVSRLFPTVFWAGGSYTTLQSGCQPETNLQVAV